MNGGNTYFLKLALRDPLTGKVHDDITFPTSLSAEQVVPTMQGLTDSHIFQLLYGRTPTREELNNLAKASQKPL
jgi:hypothetical protein